MSYTKGNRKQRCIAASLLPAPCSLLPISTVNFSFVRLLSK
ncbi:hypothetical protein [Moorena sp. SIO3H5]|nr:hypothetical protein [Moorena sp. SIO3H5]